MSDSLPYTRTMRIDLSPEGEMSAITAPSSTVTLGVAVEEPAESAATPFERLLDSIYDAVLITDGGGIVRHSNQRASDFFLISGAKLRGRLVIDFISGGDTAVLDQIRHNLEAYKYTIVEAYCTRSDGTTFPAEIAITRILLASEWLFCFFVRDITTRTRAQQELKNAVERLEALDRARQEFVSNVSHELRTPLTSMIYAVRNMQRGVAGELPEKAIQYLDRLHADCRRLQNTVNDILDLRQIENQTLTLSRTRVPLARLVEVGTESLRVQAEEKRVRLVICRPARTGFVMCDIHRMERVVLNIVGNAIKFTPEGGTVAVTVECAAAGSNEVIFKVRDTGIGIPPEALDHITVRYFKVGDQPIGSGLGLAISRELVALHGGKLQVESPAPGSDRGTQVTVALPLVPAPRILLATADAATLEQLALVCEGQGYPTCRATSAAEVLQECRKEVPDLLVVDEELPDQPGIDLLLQLRSDRRTARLPGVLITSHSRQHPQHDMLLAFQVPLLPRPIRDQTLLTALHSIFYDRIFTANRPGGSATSTIIAP